jgi:methyltransferase (TIGR00027 family)
MKDKQSSMTALIASFGRAYHFENDTPIIFSDCVARQLMTDDEYKQIAEYMTGGIDFFAPEKKNELTNKDQVLKWIVQTQISPTPLARAKYCEDMLENAIRAGAEQYVILGAGMDTFAYRNDDVLTQIKVFELDHPNTQMFKKQKVLQVGFKISENVHYVPIDFAKDNVADELEKAGFDRNKRTFFSWLGVTYYLSKEQILNTLQTLSVISTKGSSIVFDYADEKLFVSNIKRVKNMIAMAKAGGEPMQSCFSYKELEELLGKADFLLYEHLSTENIEEQFFAGRNDYLHAFEHINYALAVKR